MQYPQWWERLIAALIDGIILAVVGFVIATIFVAMGGYSITAVRILGLFAALINTAIYVGYKVFFEAGAWQATPGKMIFGLKVVDDRGQRANLQQVVLRTWPWWLSLLSVFGAVLLIAWVINLIVFLALVAIFASFFMTPVGRCLHDRTAGLHVIKAGPGMINIQVNTGR
jgi:uncharacterized RDD family membrane protein YckC